VPEVFLTLQRTLDLIVELTWKMLARGPIDGVTASRERRREMRISRYLSFVTVSARRGGHSSSGLLSRVDGAATPLPGLTKRSRRVVRQVGNSPKWNYNNIE
jgi:hypothetical protein